MTCRSRSRSSSLRRRSFSSSRSSFSGSCGSGRCSSRTRTDACCRASSAAIFLSTPLRVVLQLVSVVIFVFTLATALVGTTTELLNFAPTFVYVIFWLGVPLLSVLFGNVWRALSPWRAIADGAVWLLELGGREARPVLEVERSLGPVSGRGRAALLRRARADESTTGLSPDARDRDLPLLVLGACGDGGVRSRRLVTRRRRLRRHVRAALAHRAVRCPRRPRRRSLAVHRSRWV